MAPGNIGQSKKSRTMSGVSVSLGHMLLGATTLLFVLPVNLASENVMEMGLGSSEPLTLMWGIADTVAYVGQLFTYTLPSDAFQGNIISYKVTESGRDEVPKWLTFNELKAELKGIPGVENRGSVYITVKAIGDDNSHAEDVFVIEVLEDTHSSISAQQADRKNGPKSVRCNRDGPQTTVTVIVDSDLNSMSPRNKIGLIENMANHLNLAPEMLKVVPVGEKPMYDSSALVAGPGNIKVPQYAGALVSWLVGCGRVENDHMTALQLLEKSAANGDLNGALGYGVLGWHVTNTRFTEKPRRKRAVTATPSLTMPPPTSISDDPTDMTKPAMTSSSYIAPTQIIDIQPTQIVTSSSSASSSSSSSSSEAIIPTSTIKMEKTDTPVMTTTKVVMTTSAIPATTTKAPTTTAKPTTTTERTTTARTTTMKPTTMKPKVVTPEPECPPGMLPKKAPKLKNPIRDVSIESGVIKKIRIPEDTFFDCNDGATSDLMLEVLDSDGRQLPTDFWLKVIHRPARPYSILMNPLNTDAGTYNFKLQATNFNSMHTSQDLSVIVEGKEMSEYPPTHELSMTLDADYDEFMSDIENRVELANKVADLYGDKNSKYLTVTRLGRGSVVYSWTNNSMGGQGCPVDGVSDLVSKLIDDEGNLTPAVQDAMQPYTINGISSAPLGACTGNPNFPVRNARRVPLSTARPSQQTTSRPAIANQTQAPPKAEKTTPRVDITTSPQVAAAGAGGGSDMWITTVVPAIVVVVVLIIALLIACCLYRKKRQGRMKLQEKDPFATNKGVPVIFADEYEEKPNDSTRPLIMEDEKPPMPPPEYPRASSETSGNSNSTQPIEDKDVEEIEMEDTDITSPLYSPPPPVTASNNSKPPHVQSSRGPPPYVPP